MITDKTVERRINREDKWISPLCLAAKGVVKAAAGVAVISTQTLLKVGKFNRLVARAPKRHEQQADNRTIIDGPAGKQPRGLTSVRWHRPGTSTGVFIEATVSIAV